jgi:DNA-binding winged helix-turn-helix (wHTH) protein
MSAPESPSTQLKIAEGALPAPCLPSRYVRFGSFQVDRQREILSRDGERVRMQSKVYQTLVLLLSQPGDIVTREEVAKRVWPQGFQANSDANVNTAVNKLRQALGDSAENSMYVETIPRRGYCFIAPLEFSDFAAPASAKLGEATGMAAGDSDPEPRSLQLPYTLPVALRIVTLLFAGMVLGALFVLVWHSVAGRSHKTLLSKKESASRPPAELHLCRG